MLKSLVLLLALVAYSHQASLLSLKPNVNVDDIKACRGEDVLSCEVAEVDLDLLTTGSFDLPGCADARKKNDIQEPAARSGMADQARSFAVENALGCIGILSVRGEKVRISVELPDGKAFDLEPCSTFPGCHVWKEEEDMGDNTDDTEEDPEDDEDNSLMRGILSENELDALVQKGIADSSTIVTLSVRFYYTLDYAEETDDIELEMDQRVAATNQAYINSNVPVRISLFCIEPLNIREPTNPLPALRASKDSIEEVLGSADLASLVWALKYTYSGKGSVNSFRNGGSVTAVKKTCMLCLAHEIGHNFGASHTRKSADKIDKGRYPFAGGSTIGPAYLDKRGYSSIMHAREPGHKDRIMYFSNPDVLFKGYPTGSEMENNARVMTLNRFVFAANGDESGTCGGIQN